MGMVVTHAELHWVDRMIFDSLKPIMEAALNKAAEPAIQDIKDLIDTPVEVDPVTGHIIRSDPGEPPRTETGELLNNIGADIIADASNMSITLTVTSNRPSTPEVPGILEYGGMSNWGEIAPRPYMSTAFNENINQWISVVIDAMGGEKL